MQRRFLTDKPATAALQDTVHGKFKHDVKIGEKDELIVNGNKIKQLGSAKITECFSLLSSLAHAMCKRPEAGAWSC